LCSQDPSPTVIYTLSLHDALPILSVALSRANMGNYHPETFYDDAHEVSPFDANSIAPEYSEFWHEMNHVEKCLFWWFICYREIRSEEHTSELQSRENLVCRLLLEK